MWSIKCATISRGAAALLLITGLLQAPLAEAGRKGDGYLFQISPFVGYRFGGSFEDEETEEDYDVENGSSVGFVLNFPAQQYSEYEIYYSHQSTELKTGSLLASESVIDLDIQYLHIGGTYLVDRTKKVQPYIVATVGATRIDPSGADTSADEFFSFSVGGGWKFFPEERIGIRLDGRFLGTVIDSNTDIFCQTGQEGNQCLIQNRGDMLWQFEAQASVIFRF
jgi:hypothetical protein